MPITTGRLAPHSARAAATSRRRLARKAFDQGLSAERVASLFEVPADEVAAWSQHQR